MQRLWLDPELQWMFCHYNIVHFDVGIAYTAVQISHCVYNYVYIYMYEFITGVDWYAWYSAEPVESCVLYLYKADL